MADLLDELKRLDGDIPELATDPLYGLLFDLSTSPAFTEFDGKAATGIVALRTALPELIAFVEAHDKLLVHFQAVVKYSLDEEFIEAEEADDELAVGVEAKLCRDALAKKLGDGK